MWAQGLSFWSFNGHTNFISPKYLTRILPLDLVRYLSRRTFYLLFPASRHGRCFLCQTRVPVLRAESIFAPSSQITAERKQMVIRHYWLPISIILSVCAMTTGWWFKWLGWILIGWYTKYSQQWQWIALSSMWYNGQILSESCIGYFCQTPLMLKWSWKLRADDVGGNLVQANGSLWI